MADRAANPVIADLQERIAHHQSGGGHTRDVLPFGMPEIDRRLPGEGLALGALHEIAGGGNGAVDGAAAARSPSGSPPGPRKVLWIVTHADLSRRRSRRRDLPGSRHPCRSRR